MYILHIWANLWLKALGKFWERSAYRYEFNPRGEPQENAQNVSYRSTMKIKYCSMWQPIYCLEVLEMGDILTYLLTYSLTHSPTHSLHGAGHYLKSRLSPSLSKKYPAFLWNSKVHYCVHTSPPLGHILSQLNQVCPIDPYLPKAHLNVILPPWVTTGTVIY
jgi:hypothetical protein